MLCLFMRHFIFCTCVKMEENHQLSTVSIAEKFHEESTFYSAIMQEKITSYKSRFCGAYLWNKFGGL